MNEPITQNVVRVRAGASPQSSPPSTWPFLLMAITFAVMTALSWGRNLRLLSAWLGL
ncbi:MAG: hypothetical protein K9N49_08100 [Candidatus Marinimicrobia bacterium]|nr:hypothetical protein [Candidatus Neomarinimicrobiota bacterium]